MAKSNNANAIFTFRISRLIKKGEDNQLLCGDYINKRDKRCSNAQLHWGQHHFLSGLFYSFQYPDGKVITSYDRGEDMPQADFTFNYKEKQVAKVVKQIEALRETIEAFPTNDEGVIEKEFQAKYQLQIHVKGDSFLTAELNEEGEQTRVKTRFRSADIVDILIVERGTDNFIYTGKGDRMKTLDFMKAFYGEGQEASPELDSVDKIKARYLTRAEKRSIKRRQSKENINAELSNKVIKESVTLNEEETDDELVF